MSIKYVTRMVVLASIMLTHFTWSNAQQPSGTAARTISSEKRALIAELLNITDARKNAVTVFNSMLDQNEKQMPDVIWQSLANMKEVQELTVDQQESLRKKFADDSNRLNNRIRALFLERIDFARLMEDLSYDLYDRYFTEPELSDLITFYRSPTGRKTIEVMPKMITDSFASALEAIKPKLAEIVTTLAEEESERVKKDLQVRKSTQPVRTNSPRRPRKA